MKSKPLTDVACRNAKYNPDKTNNKRADGGGLYLELMPSGSKIWRLKYRFDGKENRLTYGDYPVVGLAEARQLRDEAKKLLLQGINPGAHRDGKRAAAKLATTNSFETVSREWYETKKGGWSESHATRVMKQLERELIPAIGAKAVIDTNAPDLLAVIRKIEARGALETANKTLQTAGQVFRYAIVTGRAERDPSADLRGALKTRPVTHMRRIKEADLPALLQGIATYDGDPQTRLALKFLCLTFVRTIELRHAEWSEIDEEKAEWRVPAEKMKMKQSHIVPLSKQALALLKELRELTGTSHWVFPSMVGANKPMSENTVLYALYRLGYRSRMTGHGFRGLASTILNENGFKSDWIERQLAHGERDVVRAAYNHAFHLADRREMMQWWADYIDQKAGDKVVSLEAGESQGLRSGPID